MNWLANLGMALLLRECTYLSEQSGAVGVNIAEALNISIVPIDKNMPSCFCSLLRVKPGAVSVIC